MTLTHHFTFEVFIHPFTLKERKIFEALPHTKCIDVAEATNVHYHGCGQNLSNFLPGNLNLGRLHTYISQFTNIGYQTILF